MTTTQILDAIAPYTQEDQRCGRKKKKKMEYRYALLMQIERMQKRGLHNEDICKYLMNPKGITELQPDWKETAVWLNSKSKI